MRNKNAGMKYLSLPLIFYCLTDWQTFFYRAASMQGGLNHERNVCPSNARIV